jgi:hypothetical protein
MATITFRSCGGDGESTSVAFQIRLARAQQGKVEKLSRLEFELLGLFKIESSRTGTESLLSLQLCFEWRHTSLFLLQGGS